MHWFPDNIEDLPPFSHGWLAVLSAGIICGIAALMLALSLIPGRRLPSEALTMGTVAVFLLASVATFYVWQFQLDFPAAPTYVAGDPTVQAMEDELARLNAELYQLVLRAYAWKSAMAGFGLGAILSGCRLMRERLPKYNRVTGISLAAVGAGAMCGVAQIILSA